MRKYKRPIFVCLQGVIVKVVYKTLRLR